MPNPKKEVPFAIDTIEDMFFNPHLNNYLSQLEALLKDGFSLAFYRVGQDERLTTIKDINHFHNFKRSFRNPEIK